MTLKPIQFLIKKLLKSKHLSIKSLELLKKETAFLFNTKCHSNIEILTEYKRLVKRKKIPKNPRLETLLLKQKSRTISGIASVAVLTKAFPCPGRCIYCPKESAMPKSYFSNEPAVMRAILCKFDPEKQVRTRINALEAMGHSAEKIELIILGGTFSSLPRQYRTWFIKKCFEGANGQNQRVKSKNNLEEVQKKNEKAKHRIIGITIETRPDLIDLKEIKYLRRLGVTRVELGVQSIYDDILNLSRRGHLVKETIKATKLLKNTGFKVCYHLMPNLPGSGPSRDLKMFEKIFSDENFKPDLLKIYPCVVTKNSPLEEYYKRKKYLPYSNKKLIELISRIKTKIPCYVRIMRLGRDIPAQNIIAGCKLSNLREYVQKEMKKKNIHCNCIRCREIREKTIKKSEAKMFRYEYKASQGKEIFLSFENKKRRVLFALLRLRIPEASPQRKKCQATRNFLCLKNSALIREIHTYGESLPIKQKKARATQHIGFGKKLIMKAEKIAQKEFNLAKMAIISGVGVRDYYRKLGYRLKDTYMIKKLK